MKYLYLFAINVILSRLIAQTPITLGNTNMPGSGDTLRYTNAQVNSVGNYTQTGVNFNWNFSALISTTEGVRSFKPTLQTPYALFFLPNEYGEKIADTLGAGPLTITKYYNYYKKQTSPSAFITDGVGLTFSNVPVPSYYSDKDELYNFPMSYPKHDSSTFKFSTPPSGILPIIYSKSGYRITEVDGWGTITTPYGTEACLRLITTQYAMDSIKNNIIPFPFGFPNYQRSYQWLSATGKIPYLEITGNLLGSNFTVTQVRYRGYNKAGPPTAITEIVKDLNILVYPSPAKDKLYLRNTGDKPAPFRVFNLQGLMTGNGTALPGTETCVDLTTLAPGLYLVQLQGEKSGECIRFLKE
jgi:hypothetical protein